MANKSFKQNKNVKKPKRGKKKGKAPFMMGAY